MSSTVFYTKVDEAPALATYSLLPIIKGFLKQADISVVEKDISLSGRILAANQLADDALAELGELVKNSQTTIIKLPNISASVPQLTAAINELRSKGYKIPDYPHDCYQKVLGSAVNPVLREGNSDRRSPLSVKNYAKKFPHRLGSWDADSKTHVSHMDDGDFYGNEKSVALLKSAQVRIEFINQKGASHVLKDFFPVLEGEILDATFMSKKKLTQFLKESLSDAKKKEVLFSIHLKSTMMKISDPVIFGAAVSVYFEDLFQKYKKTFDTLGINPNNGIQTLINNLDKLDTSTKVEIQEDIKDCYSKNPDLAMVNSDKGITNLHVPSDVIVDASMPAMIRDSGKMWGPDGKLHDTKAVIPDRCYAGVYQAVIEDCKKNGAFDPKTMGSVSNVGLMAQKAEEYGSHDKTFQAPDDGYIRIINANNDLLIEHQVEKGDIWRACQVKDVPVQDWVKLAVDRARISNTPAVFWLDKNRAHDRELIKKVTTYLKQHDTSGLDIQILSPVEATKFSIKRLRDGQDTISVTGNVLRDYNTDLFPILELGTSSKMLSIVPLISGGRLFETGAGGSAPKHVQQFLEENHLRWDSLGEFLALQACLEHIGISTSNAKAKTLASTLDKAIERYLQENKSPSRKVGELDTRGSHFYLALFWAQALAEQTENTTLKAHFSETSETLKKQEKKHIDDLTNAQGKAVDIGGYYKPDDRLAAKAVCQITIL